MAADIEPVRAACHCGHVRFTVALKDGLNSARRCDCSFCRMRGAVAVSAELGELKILSGEDALSAYRFGTKTAAHFFCLVCGVYTHHQRRSNPNELGVNLACIENLSPFDLKEVPVMDGVRHPSDLGAGAQPRLAGVLHYRAVGD